MSRSNWKGVNSKISFKPDTESIIVHRADMLVPELMDKKVLIHTGNSWKTLHVNNVHIGQKAGQFAATKYPAIFKRNKRKIGRIKYGS